MNKSLILSILILLGSASAAWSQDCETVPGNVLENCSFEADILDPGDWEVRAPTGWSLSVSGTNDWGIANFDAAVFTGKTGNNTAWLNPVSGGSTANQICQQISDAMVDGVTYTIRGDMCRRTGFFEPVNFWIALRRATNSEIIVSTRSNPAEGECLPAPEVSFVASGGDVGQPLRACISVIATPSNPAQVHYDNLVATPVDLKSFSID